MIKQLRVGTFNLFNLVLPNTKYYDKREYSLGKYKKKARWINEQLKKMRADIVGFQEIFHEEAIKGLLSRNSAYKEAHVITTPPSGKKPVVGLLSKFPIKNYEVITDFPEKIDLLDDEEESTDHIIPLQKFSRPVLRAEIALADDFIISVFVIHLKSKRPVYPNGIDEHNPIEKSKGQLRALIKRASEANAIRQIFIKHRLEYPDYPVVVLGDLNDSGGAVTTNLIAGERPWVHKPTGVKFKDWMELKKMSWSVLLHNCKNIQARQSFKDLYYTHIYNGHHECLDHILVSNEFADSNKNRIGRVMNIQVFNDHLIDETLSGDAVPIWQSDHGQVVASIEFDRLDDE
ncbi:MAG: endonuclease/exonuclease/phosphatase family protein [Flammeovirgaceae bacterium]